jgi:hypothetical protein
MRLQSCVVVHSCFRIAVVKVHETDFLLDIMQDDEALSKRMLNDPNIPMAHAISVDESWNHHHHPSAAAPPPLAPPRMMVDHQPPPTLPGPPPPLSQAARGILKEQGYTNGLIDALEMNRRAFPISYWIVDNSGSMATADGHRILPQPNGTLKLASCTRWKEMQETVEYHSQLAAVLHSPTTYTLLNDPGAVAGPQTFRVAHDSESTASIDYDLAVAQSVMMNAQPAGVTPLAHHIEIIRTEIQQMESFLRSTGGKVAIVLATDGLPTDARGYSNPTVKQQFVDTLRSLEGMPVWIVVRLCTDADEVVQYWNDLDEQLELSLEVLVRKSAILLIVLLLRLLLAFSIHLPPAVHLTTFHFFFLFIIITTNNKDDFVAEAEEVHNHNKWLNYALPLHRMRELGFYHKMFDLLDERTLSQGDLKDFMKILFGHGPLAEAPDPEGDWKGFTDVLARLVGQESMQWNPMTKRMEPWIDMRKLKQQYGGAGSFFGSFFS